MNKLHKWLLTWLIHKAITPTEYDYNVVVIFKSIEDGWRNCFPEDTNPTVKESLKELLVESFSRRSA